MPLAAGSKRKQNLTHADFQRMFDDTPGTLPEPTWQRLFDAAVERVKALRDRYAGRIAFAWSGGKDSLALELVCRAAGIGPCCFGMTQGPEYPAFLAWVTDHMPPELEVIKNDWDLAWLKDNPAMLFPRTAAVAGRWFAGIQHAAQERYFDKRKLRCLLLGRRWADGNYTGRGRGQWLYEAGGVVRASPLADWSHQAVFAAIRYGLRWTLRDLPPFYRWPRGWRCGTHAWPARQWCMSVNHGWAEVFAIDSSIVRQAAAAGIESAGEWLAFARVGRRN